MKRRRKIESRGNLKQRGGKEEQKKEASEWKGGKGKNSRERKR